MEETNRVRFEKFVYGGDCLGRLDDGRAIFVPFALPGETAEVEITESKERFARGALINLVETSPDRVEAPCPYFTVCGGCRYQHISYAQQAELKKDLVRDQLERIGKFTSIPPLSITPSPSAWAYRNQVQFHLSQDGKPGFKRWNSDQVLPILKCLLIGEQLNELLAQIELEADSGLSRLVFRQDSDDELMLVFEGGLEDAPDLSIELPVSAVYLDANKQSFNLSGNDALVYEVLGKDFLVSPESFFQINLPVAENMIQYVQGLLYGQKNLRMLELYSGVGLFTRFLAPLAAELTAIESSPSSCFDFVGNLDEFDHVSLYEGEVESILPGLVDQFKPIDLVVLDPPRAGLNTRARQALIDLNPQQIIYISCDPSTIARDLKHLCESGYSLQSVHAFDMFPQTHHVETIVVIHRAQRVTS